LKAKWNLTKSEQRAASANAERFKSAGLAIGVGPANSSEAPLLRIEQSGDSVIYAGTLGGMALAACLRITVLKSGITLLDDPQVTIPGCDDGSIFFVPLQEDSLSYRVLTWLDLPKDVVLNHRIFSGCPLPCGWIFDGFLVTQSFAPLPSQFRSGMLIPATIRFADLWGNLFTSEVRFGVEQFKQSGVRPEKRPSGASDRHSTSAQDHELRGRDPKPTDGIASVKKGNPAIRSQL
jgi:hypothetical protein